MGLFPRAHWLEQIAAAGFQPLAVPFEHSAYADAGLEVFLGIRTCANLLMAAMWPAARPEMSISRARHRPQV
jgi:hypothetical protein